MVFAIDEPTKLYIFNLDYCVSNDDIKVTLFLLPLNRAGISDSSLDSLVLLTLLQGNKQFDSPYFVMLHHSISTQATCSSSLA
jgi:hypothetical protein